MTVAEYKENIFIVISETSAGYIMVEYTSSSVEHAKKYFSDFLSFQN